MLAEMTAMHVPVLAPEVLAALDPQPGETAIDCTFGAGGHAKLLAQRLGHDGLLIAIDRDPVAEENFAALAADVDCRTRFIRAGFAEGLEQLRDEGTRVEMVYMDLGMSSMQIDTLERGFSYVYDAPLDMRMDPDQPLSARDVINGWEERQLIRALKELGEERYARQVAKAIVRNRPIETTQELVDVVSNAIPAPSRFGGGHPAKRTFQAVRIVVNDELGQLERALPSPGTSSTSTADLQGFPSTRWKTAREAIPRRPRARLRVPARLPRLRLRRRARGRADRPRDRAVADEIAVNPRARSARMRAARKLETRP
jgi:16S rRNA (cytosine1402-N4)-methyltransferase